MHRLLVFVLVFVCTCCNGEGGDIIRANCVDGDVPKPLLFANYTRINRSMFKEIYTNANDCVEMQAPTRYPLQFNGLAFNNNHADLFFNGYCQKQSEFRTCLEMKSKKFEKCRDGTFNKTFLIYRRILEKLLDVGCANGGEKLDLFWKAYIEISFQNGEWLDGNYFKMCVYKSIIMLSDLDKSNVDISSTLFLIYTQMQQVKECVLENETVPRVREIFNLFLDEIMKSIECVHPHDGALVPCRSMDASMIAVTNVCDVKARTYQMPIYDALETETGRCLNFMLVRDDLKWLEETTTTNKTEIGRDFERTICITWIITLLDIRDVHLFASSCLNGTQKQEFNNFVGFVETARNLSCLDRGKRFADIMFEVYRLKRTGHGHAVWDCVDAAKSSRSELDEHRSSSLNMRFYRELEAFKGCLVVKLVNDETSVAAATSLIDDMLRNVKCDPEEGVNVLCGTLVNTTLPGN